MGNAAYTSDRQQTKPEDFLFKHYAWFYQSNPHPWSSKETSTWASYSSIETEIIEEAYQQRKFDTFVDLQYYLIDLRKNIQISKNDRSKERKIKRELIDSKKIIEENNRRLSSLMAVVEPFNDVPSGGGYHGFIRIWRKRNECLSTNDLLERAADGIVFEAAKAGYDFIKAKWIAERLRNMKDKSKSDISITCLRLYTKSSFLYKMINEILRENDLSKIETTAPFCFLLFQTSYDSSLNDFHYWGQVYRGVNLEDNAIEQCKRAIGQWKCWFQFTSASKQRSVAEIFGNTLFIINIELTRGGLSLMNLSEFPMEDEVLLPAGTQIRIDKVVYDESNRKHYIYVTAETNDTVSGDFKTE